MDVEANRIIDFYIIQICHDRLGFVADYFVEARFRRLKLVVCGETSILLDGGWLVLQMIAGIVMNPNVRQRADGFVEQALVVFHLGQKVEDINQGGIPLLLSMFH